MSYGFDVDRLLVWVSPRDPAAEPMRSGSLCLRHADAMVVPRGWTLDDRRDAGPRLFRPGSATPSVPAPRARRASVRRTPSERLPLRDVSASEPGGPTPDDLAVIPTVAAVAGASEAVDPDDTVAIPWLPDVDDDDDDLGGVLSADSPLLARAFRGTDRPR